METVRSTWAQDAIVTGAGLDAPEWAGAAELPLKPVGAVLVKNDARFLYLGIDVTADWGDDPDGDDWFWVVVDEGGDRVITPHRDRFYGLWPGQPDRLAKSYFQGPRLWTTVREPEPGSQLARGFGASPADAGAHRTWELRLPLSEVGVELAAGSVPAVLNVGVYIGSASPFIQQQWPQNLHEDFSDQILLAARPATTYPPGTEGAVIGGIGLVPATAIFTANPADSARYGRATTLPGYAVPVSDASFGGALNVIGNRVMMQNVWGQNARRYRVLYRRVDAGAPFTPLRQAWVNHRWDGTTYVPESYGPDTGGSYPLPDPSQDYSIDDLLVRWQSDRGFAAGVYELQAEFLRSDGSVVATPPQTLTLRLANAGPTVELTRIGRGGAAIRACQQVQISAADPALDFEFSAHDAEVGLAGYGLWARWGENQSALITSGSYAPPPPWDGVHLIYTPPDWAPPVSCAYSFEVSASSRVTDGYSPSIRGGRVSRFVTVVRI